MYFILTTRKIACSEDNMSDNHIFVTTTTHLVTIFSFVKKELIITKYVVVSDYRRIYLSTKMCS